MNCTKNEAALVLKRWYRNRSNLLLAFQASVNTEAVRMRGLIAKVDADGFLFVSKSCSVSIPFDSTVFEYEEGTKEELTQRDKPQAAFCRLRLQVHTEKAVAATSAAIALASTVLSITETTL